MLIPALWLASLGSALAALDSFYVPTLPGVDPDVTLPEMYAGTIDVPLGAPGDTAGGTNTDAPDASEAMFFWLYESQYRASKPKTLIWLNGGPGCSSLDGALLELGPLRFMGKDKIQYNAGNWGEFVNVLYLDQPFGTGFSFVDDPAHLVASVEQAATFVDKFLAQWLEQFPHHAHDDFYIGGESFAGQYIPYIHQALTALKPSGLILCNPWLDAPHQYLSYAPFAKEHGLIAPEHFAHLDELHARCAESLQSGGKVTIDNRECDAVSDFILQESVGAGQCFNIYDYELQDSYPSCGLNWPESVGEMPAYLNSEEVWRALHVGASYGSQKWTECSTPVHKKMRTTEDVSAITFLPEILHETPVLIMVGELDFVCNYKGLEEMANSLVWGQNQLAGSARGWSGPGEEYHDILWDGDVVGTARSGRNLTFARIRNGTHMIPVDKQFETRAVLHKFLGITAEYDEWPSVGEPHEPTTSSPSPSPSSTTDTGTGESPEAYKARMDAYKRAGITALVVIILVAIALILWLVYKGDVHISLAGLSSAFARALLHVGTPKIRKPFQYVNLDTFRPSGVPDTIVEEEEDEYEV